MTSSPSPQERGPGGEDKHINNENTNTKHTSPNHRIAP